MKNQNKFQIAQLCINLINEFVILICYICSSITVFYVATLWRTDLGEHTRLIRSEIDLKKAIHCLIPRLHSHSSRHNWSSTVYIAYAAICNSSAFKEHKALRQETGQVFLKSSQDCQYNCQIKPLVCVPFTSC